MFYHEGGVPGAVTMTSRLLLLFNSCVNPIVYALWKKDIRSELRKMFRMKSERYDEQALEAPGNGNNSVDIPTDDVSLSSKMTADQQGYDIAGAGRLISPQNNGNN